jgi:hypothetical protein
VVVKEYSYTSTPPMGRTAGTEPQCLYKGAIYLSHLFIVLGLLDPKHEGNRVPRNFSIYLLVETPLTTHKTLVFSNKAVRISSDTILPFYDSLQIQILSIHPLAPCVCVCFLLIFYNCI